MSEVFLSKFVKTSQRGEAACEMISIIISVIKKTFLTIKNICPCEK